MPHRVTHILAWTSALAWAAVIFSMSAVPGSSVPGRFGSLAHFGEYAVFAVLLVIALRHKRTTLSALLLAVAIAAAYGVTDELHQSFVPLRTPDPLDWLVDTAGAATGACATAIAVRFREAKARV